MDKIREYLLKLRNWPSHWLMIFNIDKCKVMHIGKSSSNACYVMAYGVIYWRRLMKKGSGVITSSELKVSKQW